MMTRIAVAGLALLLALAGCTQAPPPTWLTGVHLQATFDVPEQIEGHAPSHPQMNYLLYLPETYGHDPNQLWPLILFLHGAGDVDNDSGFVMSYGLPEVLYAGDQPDAFPFIVVSPQAFPNVTWWDGDTLAILNALLDDVIDRYQVDPSRIYLTGLSMGGYGSWFLATAYPDRFAAMVSVSGSGYRTPTAPPETLCKLKDTPVSVIHGTQDLISDPVAAKFYAIGLEQCGGEVELTIYPDTGHFTTFERAYRDPALYDWLLSHSR